MPFSRHWGLQQSEHWTEFQPTGAFVLVVVKRSYVYPTLTHAHMHTLIHTHATVMTSFEIIIKGGTESETGDLK